MSHSTYGSGTTPQNIGHPTRDVTHTKWRNSILVGPQTAGLPTVHNEDEWAQPGDVLGSDNAMQPPATETDFTGGALDYHKTQRRKK
jgi:hypothetical protein